MKLIGIGINYFKDNWNNFDFIVVVLSLATTLLEVLGIFGEVGNFQVLIKFLNLG